MKNKDNINVVYSPIVDRHIQKDIANSPIWKECYHETDDKPDVNLNRYYIKFDGKTPIQVTKIKLV